MGWNLKDKRPAVWTSGLILLTISFIIRFVALNQTPYANGWDGYYYVMQAHSFIEYGHLQSLDYSLIYPYYIVLSYLIPDYELAFKIGTAILAGVFTLLTFQLIYKYSAKIHLAVLGAALTIFSPGITFFVSQFPKNLLGLIFLLPAVYYILRKRHVLSILFILLSFLTHRMTGALGVIFFLISFIRSVSWKYLLGTAGILVLLSLLPGILGISDLERFSGAFSRYPRFNPISFIQLGVVHWNALWILEIMVGSLLLLYYSYRKIKHYIKGKQISLEGLILLTIAVLVLFPFFRISQGSMGYRFILLLPFVTPFLIVFALRKLKETALLPISLILIVSSEFNYEAYDPGIHDAPNKLYMVIAATIIDNYDPAHYQLVIAHKSLAEVIIYKSDFDALNWSVPSGIEREKVLRVVHGIPHRILSRYITADSREQMVRVDASYCIMPELTWQAILEKAEDDSQFMTLVRKGNNPLQPRPQYLLKGKAS